MTWEWEKGSVLYNQTPQVQTNRIFQAVCDELGRYYTEKGFGYHKGQNSVVFEDNNIKAYVTILLSYENMEEKSIWIEISSVFYDTQLTRDCTGDNILFSYNDITFDYDLQNPSEKHIVKQLYGREVEVENMAGKKDCETVWYGRSCGIYNITPENFLKITEYINKRIFPWVKKIQTLQGVQELIERKRLRQECGAAEVANKEGTCFEQYVGRNFPEILKSVRK